MTHTTVTHAPENGMEGTMTVNGRQGASGPGGAKDLRNAPRVGHSLRCPAEPGHRAPEGAPGAGSGPRTGRPPFKHESGHGQSERTRSEASPARSPGRWFGSARAGLGARAGSRTPLRRGTPPETPYVAAHLRRGGLLPRFSLLGRAARLLAAVLALAVPLLAVLVLNDAAPAQAQANQPTPGKPVLTLRKWPYHYTPEVVVIPGPPIAKVTVLGHYQLSWPHPDYPIYKFQFVVDKLPEYVKVQGRWSNVNDEGVYYEYVRVIGPYDAVRTIRMRGKNYSGRNCAGTGPCEGAGVWSDPPQVVRPTLPPLPMGQVEAPTITGSPALSESGSDGAWSAGETVEVTLTFSEAVTVDTTGGSPSIGLDLGGTESRSATYLRGSGTTALVFGYTLTAADGSHTSLLVPIDSLALNGGTIRSQATSADAALEHSGAAKAGSTSIGARDEGDTPEVENTFTARFGALPQNHNGSDAFTFELHFSAAPEGLSHTTVAGGLLDVTGAAVTKARRLTAGSNLGWEVTVTPSQSGDVAIRLPARACSETNAVCVGGSPLGKAVSATVRGVPFTASFSGVPAEHGGAAAFDIRFHLSAEPATLSYRTVHNGLFAVTGGSIEKASRLAAGKNNGWSVRIDPSGLGDVRVRVRGTSACDTAPGVCTPDGRKLAGGRQVVIAGLAALSVADAEVDEGADATLAFTVTLSKARSTATTVSYATSDGTATAGSDYTLTSGTLSFGPLETSKTVSVPVLNDSHDEGSETLTLTLSNPSPSSVKLANASATGTIRNTDAMPQAWIARFGRTVADQVLDAVESRMRAPRTPGVEVSLAGQRLGGAELQNGGAAGKTAAADDSAQAERNLADWLRNGTDPDRQRGIGARPVTERELLTGSSFALAGGEKASGFYSLWGRGAVSRFDGRDGALSLDGEVASGMLGADWTRGAVTAGLVVSHSLGEGAYRGAAGGPANGAVSSSLTGFYPWGRYALSDRLSVWGVAGYGEGTLTLTPEGQAPIRTDLDLTMAAAGLRGVLVAAPETGGFELAVKTDAMDVRTSTAKANGSAGGNLEAAEAEVTRLRLGLEGSRRFGFEDGATLTPSVEIGVRQDGGDAETGFGVDIGGGIAWSDPQRGLSAELRGRGLMSHEAEGFRERGFSGALGFDPTPSSDRGLKLTMSQTVGAQASGGADALLSRGTLAGLAANDNGGGRGDELAQRRFEARFGYGLAAFDDRFTMTPEIGLGLSNAGRDYSLGWRLAREAGFGGALELSMEARRRESANDNADAPPVHEVGVRLTSRF